MINAHTLDAETAADVLAAVRGTVAEWLDVDTADMDMTDPDHEHGAWQIHFTDGPAEWTEVARHVMWDYFPEVNWEAVDGTVSLWPGQAACACP